MYFHRGQSIPYQTSMLKVLKSIEKWDKYAPSFKTWKRKSPDYCRFLTTAEAGVESKGQCPFVILTCINTL